MFREMEAACEAARATRHAKAKEARNAFRREKRLAKQAEFAAGEIARQRLVDAIRVNEPAPAPNVLWEEANKFATRVANGLDRADYYFARNMYALAFSPPPTRGEGGK